MLAWPRSGRVIPEGALSQGGTIGQRLRSGVLPKMVGGEGPQVWDCVLGVPRGRCSQWTGRSWARSWVDRSGGLAGLQSLGVLSLE